MYFLSPMQEGMLFHYLENRSSLIYFEQMVYQINGQLDFALFEQAFIHLVDRYDILRTIFVYEKVQKSLQVVLKKRTTGIYYQDISYLSEDEKERITQDFRMKDRTRGFDLSKDIPVRISIIKTSQQSYLMIFSFHHIILDGWSMGIVYMDLIQIYQALLAKKTVSLPPVNQYKTYINWITAQNMTEGLEYWQKYLDGYDRSATLPKNFAKKSGHEITRAIYQFVIDEKRTEEIITFARANSVTQNLVFQALWGILLCKYNHTSDVVFGVIISGRPPELDDIERMAGLFLNNVPFRIKMEEGQTFVQLMGNIYEKEVLSRSYEYLPLADIQSNSLLKEKLIDHIMVFENYPISRELKNINMTQEYGFEIKALDIFEQTSYDFNIIIVPDKSTTIHFQYNSLIYDEPLIIKIAQNFEELIVRVLENPQIKIEQISKISPENKAEIIARCNENLIKEVEFMQKEEDTMQKKLHESFSTYPLHIALEQSSRTMTYEQLEERSAAVAQWIVNNNLSKETFIGILLEDRMEVIVVAVGILRAGCVMVPFYSAHPIERIAAMADTTKLEYIFIDDFNFERFNAVEAKSIASRNHIFLKDLPLAKNRVEQNFQTKIDINPEDKLYIHFTSGTTGTPKAIVGKNKSLLHFINWEIATFRISSDSRAAQFTIPGFDPFLRDVFVPLLSGGTVCIPNNYDILIDSIELKKWVDQNRITLIHCVSSLFRMLSSDPLQMNDFSALKAIMLAGEKIHPSDLVTWYKTFGERILLANCYGPTETTMSKVCYFIRAADINREKIPIGKPINGARILILDEKMDICGELEAGEICIRTPFRSWGYYNDPIMNHEKFIVNPFNDDPNDIIYRSGDLGRFLPGGNLDILGRIDRQVKIRGYRIELEEIESLLCKHPSVKEAALIQNEISPGNVILYAFVARTPWTDKADSDSLEIEDLELVLKDFLGGKLPDYMVPAQIITIEPIPRRATGKVDYAKLVELFQEQSLDVTKPRNPIEEKLSYLWTDVLHTDKISLFSRFFDLGGNSLNLMSLITRIHREFDIRISLQDFFNNPTIEKQAQLLEKTLGKLTFCPIKKAPKKSFYPLTPAQKRIFMMQQLEIESTAYNLPFSFILEGKLDRQRMIETFRKLIQRHESLRTSFKLIEGEPQQQIHPHVDFELINLDLITNIFVRSFDLSCAPLFRVGISRDEHIQGSIQYIMVIDMHHIIADGVSLGILLREFMVLYEDRQLTVLNLQYRDFAQWQNDPEQVQSRKKQELYWLQEFAGFDQSKPLNLRPDFERPEIMNFEGTTSGFAIDQEKIKALTSLASEEGTTLFTVLLTIYTILLAKISGQSDFAIGTLSAGRIHTDLDNMIGMFVNTLALRCQYEGEKTFAQYLSSIKKKSLEAFENQDYQFEDLIRELGAVRSQNRNPLFDTMFIYQNLTLQELKIPGLKLKPYELENNISKFDLSMNCSESGNGYHFHMEYSTKLFKKEKIARYADYFKQIVSSVATNKNTRLEEIFIVHELSAIEIKKVDDEFDF